MANLKEMYADFEKGMYIAEAKMDIVDGYKLAGLFPKTETKTKKATVVDAEEIDKFKDQDGKDKKIAKGASARKIRGKVTTPDGFKLYLREVEYVIDNEDMEDPSFNLTGEIKGMSYLLAGDIDAIVNNCVEENAIEITDEDINGNWDSEDVDEQGVIQDVSLFTAGIRPNPYLINTLALGNKADTWLKIKSAQSVENYELPQNGFKIRDTISLLNNRCLWGGVSVDDGAMYGFDTDNPALEILFKKYKNPNVKSVPPIPGMEALLPPISMLMYDNSQWESDPQTTIKVGVTVGAFARNNGKRMIKYPNVLSA